MTYLDSLTEDDYYFLVDLNGTLAHHEKGAPVFTAAGEPLIGKPIKRMVDRVRRLMDQGTSVRILCAAVSEDTPRAEKLRSAVKDWTKKHLGRALPVTATVTPRCIGIWNDKARGVVRNTGKFTDER